MAFRCLTTGSQRLLRYGHALPSAVPSALRSRGMQARYSSTDVVISVRDLTFEYVQSRPILDNISFNIRDGNKVTIMGQNGSGKTTILKLLSGQFTADSGEINIKDKLVVATARQVMPRESGAMTVWDFFKDALHGNDSGLDSRIAKVMNQVGLEASQKRHIRSFSGGQQARLLLAAALIVEPDMLLLDEPTNNLDVAGVAWLKDFIKNLNQTVLVSFLIFFCMSSDFPI
jgi:ATP-binding cassette subfamily F protein 3